MMNSKLSALRWFVLFALTLLAAASPRPQVAYSMPPPAGEQAALPIASDRSGLLSGTIAANTIPAARLLNPDGTLRLDGSSSGSLNLGGWDVQLDSGRGPILSPAGDGLPAPLAVNNWSALGSNGAGNGSLNGTVNALAVSGTDLYVGGWFTNVNNNGTVLGAADRIAKFDGANWSALGSNGAGGGSLNNIVAAIAVSGADLYVGGDFTDVNNNGSVLTAADYIARWNGTDWSALGSNGAWDGGPLNGSLNTYVRALAVSGADLYVGGTFFDVNNSGTRLDAADHVARWDGANWSALGSNGACGGACIDGSLIGGVFALAVDGINLYVGGDFTDVNSNGTALAAADHIAKWDGANWSALGSNGAGNGSLNYKVFALAVSDAGLYVGGRFANVSNNGTALGAADWIVRWDGTNWSALGSNGAGNGSLSNDVFALAVIGADLYVGGDFPSVNNNGTALGAAAFVARFAASESVGQYTVNSTADRDDQNTTDSRCDTGQTVLRAGQPEAECTLRAAIQQANAQADKQLIAFNIPSTALGTGPLAGVPSITPGAALPAVSDAVVIDGSTQPGGGVELNGSSAGSGASGLHITAGDSSVYGLAINRFSGHGLWLQTGGGNLVEGNLIGTSADGATGLGNGGHGVFVDNSAGNTIGGATQGAPNLISGNSGSGLAIEGSGATGNTVLGNWIGVAANGVSALGNSQNGIRIFTAANNTVGGTLTGAGNLIAFNGYRGVSAGGSATGNAILGNAIHGNTLRGIDLGEDGWTANDIGDYDTGPNNLQNFPVLTTLISNRSTITGTLDSRANTTFRVELFVNYACDMSGYGEGEQFLGAVNATTNSQGNANFTYATTAHRDGPITLTATDPENNTSEFSSCRSLVMDDPQLEHPVFPAGSWGQIPLNGTVDGNQVRIATNIENRGALYEEVQVLYIDAETGSLLPNGMTTKVLPPGNRTRIEYFWDTDGYAWKEGNRAPHLDPRRVEVRVRDVASVGEIVFDSREQQTRVRPKPLVLVHGWNSSAAAWQLYPGFAHNVRADWDVRAVNNMNTGSAQDFGQSLWKNAEALASFIDLVRAELNAWHVDLVAHSKGGLVSRTYINSDMPSFEADGKRLVSHLVMLGTPNLGSSCANLIPGDGAYEITPAFVEDVFNEQITRRKGVPFSVLAGRPLPFTCLEDHEGDSVVEFFSAWGAGSPSAYIRDMEESYELHTDMTTSAAAFLNFVLPRVRAAPSHANLTEPGRAVPASHSSQDPQLLFTDFVAVPASGAIEVNFQVTNAITLGVTLAAHSLITSTLFSPSGGVSGTIAAGSAQAEQPFRTLRVQSPPDGAWRLRLENAYTSTQTMPVSVWIEGSPLLLDLNVGQPDAQNRVFVGVTLTNSGAPLPGATVTATLTGTNASALTLTLYDDGAHGDGQAGDGVYADTTTPLSPAVYAVIARAQGPGFGRATIGSVRVTAADLSLSMSDAPDPVTVGERLTYTLVVTNSGPTDVLNLTISDTLPLTVTFVSARASQGECGEAGGVVTCTLGLSSGERVSVTIVVIPNMMGSLSNSALVMASDRDADLANNASVQVTMVNGRRIYLPLVMR